MERLVYAMVGANELTHINIVSCSNDSKIKYGDIRQAVIYSSFIHQTLTDTLSDESTNCLAT